MELKIGNDQGRVVIDDTTGKIMWVLVKNAIEGKSDCIATTSFTNHHDGTHTSLREVPSWDDWDEEEYHSDEGFNFIHWKDYNHSEEVVIEFIKDNFLSKNELPIKIKRK